VVSPANAAYSATELTHQLTHSKSKALFTCVPLLKTALEAAEKAGIPRDRIYLLDVPAEILGDAKAPTKFKTLDQLIQQGKWLPEVAKLNWGPGQGARTTAFLCYSSGTSGLPVR
jgi:acyl-CoA synthetase (AMP-forming)/AMP-acid ligase II